jgi:putative MATE family efflux protein
MVGALGGSGAVAATAVTYLQISALGVPAVLVALVGHGYLRGRSDIRTPLLVAVAANVVNLALELILVYGFHLGVRGSAWGTVVAQVLAAAAFLVVIGRRVEASRAGLKPIGAEMGRLLLAGRRLIVRTAALLAALTLASAVAARVGAATLGGHQIALQLHSFIALALDALAIPGQILVGTLLGAGDLDEARAVARRLLTVGVACGTLIGVALAASAWWLPAVFSHDPLVRRRATVALLIAGAVQVPAAVAFVLDGVLIGGSDFGALQRGVVFGLIVYLPLAALVLRFHRLGVAGVWTGLLVWMLGRAGANWRRYRSGRWMSVPST